MIVNPNLYRRPSLKSNQSSLQPLKRRFPKCKTRAKHTIAFTNQQQRKQVTNTLNKLLNIRVQKQISYKLLRTRLEYAVGSHTKIDDDEIIAKSGVGQILLKYGNAIKKCCEILISKPHSQRRRLLDFVQINCLDRVLIRKEQLEQYLQKMSQICDKQEIKPYNKLCFDKDRQEQDIYKQNIVANSRIKISHLINDMKQKQYSFFDQNKQSCLLFNDNENTLSQISEQLTLELKQHSYSRLSTNHSFISSSSDNQSSTNYHELYRLTCQTLNKDQIQQFQLNNVMIIGIIENDFRRKGKYSILLIRQKQNIDEGEFLVVFFKSKQQDWKLLAEVAKEYDGIKGYIINKEEIELFEYWQQNLEENIL